MVVCKFYINGLCRFGDRCRNEHVEANNYYDQQAYRSDGRQSQFPVQQNKFSFRSSYEQAQSQAPAHGGGFSFNKALNTVQQQENYGQDLRQSLNQRTVTFNDNPARYGRTQNDQYRGHYQQAYQETPRTHQPRESIFSSQRLEPQQPPKATGFSFSKALSDVQRAESAFSKPSLFGGSMSPQGSYNAAPASQSVLSRQVVCYDDIEMDGASMASTFGSSTTPHNQNISFGQPMSQSGASLAGVGHQQQQHEQTARQTHLTSDDYSQLSELTEEEVEAFRSNNFAFGKLPLKPPPIELCC